MAFVRVCSLADLPPGRMLRTDAGPDPVLVVNVDGRCFAVDDTCTHSNFSLAEGELDGDVVVCPLHDARFCVRDGAVLSPPAPEPLRVHAVKIEGDDVLVDLG